MVSSKKNSIRLFQVSMSYNNWTSEHKFANIWYAELAKIGLSYKTILETELLRENEWAGQHVSN